MFALIKKAPPQATISTILRATSRFSSAKATVIDPPPVSPPHLTPPDFSKLRIYKDRSVVDLLNMYVMNTVCTKDVFVDNCHHMYKFSNKLFGSYITQSLVGNTMGRIFTAGNSLETVDQFVTSWPNKNIQIYIDYSNEAVPGQILTAKELDDTTRVFCESITLASKAGSKSGIAIKVSALVLPEVLLKTNVAQVTQYSFFSQSYGNLQETLTAKQIWNKLEELNVEASFEDLKEFMGLFLNKQLTSESELETVKITKFEWLNNIHAYYINNSPKNANKILLQLTKFTPEDLSELARLSERLDLIFTKAHQEKSTVLVDAEQTYIQATIDSFTMQFSEVYNKDTAFVLNTFQNYLKSTQDRVNFEIERCKALKIPFGAKLVRGAYMVEERRLAKELNYADPIHDTVENTHDCYNMNLTNVIKNWIPNSHLMVASHNEYSNYYGKSLVKEYNITADKGHVTFIQLLGLADHLTFSNAEDGLTSAKYVPFGPIPIMIPYLIRRAQESKQMLASASLQRGFVLSELAKRLTRS